MKCEMITLGSLGKFENIGVDKKIVEGEQSVTLLNFVDIFNHKHIDSSIPSMIVTASDKKIASCDVKRGDIFVTPSSETPDDIGHSAVILEDLDNTVYSYHIMRFRLNNPDMIAAFYINYLFDTESVKKQIQKKAKGLTRFGLSKDAFASIQIPFPTLEKQESLVHKLDSFNSLISKLDEEIELRKQQFEHYRDLLLVFNGKEEVEMITLENLAEIGTGSSNTQDELDNGKYPFYVRSQIVRWKDEYEFDETAIISSGDGVGVGKVLHYVEGKYALHQRAYRIHITSSDLSPKYFFYYMQKTFYNYIMLNAYAASVTSVRRPMLLNYPVPVIDKQKQERIVFILDTFTQLISKLEEERDLRQKQYEYYREKLLTFE